MTGITIINPVIITDSMLIASDVPETDYPVYSSGTTYNLGDRVIKTSTHKIYQSLQAANTGNDPETSLTWWVEVSATNRWKMFDKSITTQTAQASSMSYQIRVGRAVNSLAVLNITEGETVRVRVIDPTYGTVYDKTINISRKPLQSSWWQWYFGERRAQTQATFLDMPTYPQADIYVDITGSTNLAIGVMIMGTPRSFGVGVQVGIRMGIQDFSRKERNDFGDIIFVERPYARRASFSLYLNSNEVDTFHTYLSDIRATPCLWIVSELYKTLVIYGFYKTFDIVIPYPTYSDCELELEGLT